MLPYVYLIEVSELDGVWAVVESTSKGTTELWSEHKWYWTAARSAHKLAKRRVTEQGPQLRLEVWYWHNKKVAKRFIYGRDPRGRVRA